MIGKLRQMRFSAVVLTAAAVMFGLAMATPARALTIVPPSLEYSVKPGAEVTAKVKLYNETATATTVFSSVANFTAKGEQGEPDFSFETKPTGTASWIDAPSGAITIQPNDRIELNVKIKVPANAEPGGHYASLFFGTDPTVKPESGGQVTIRSLLGTLVILRVEGNISEQAKVASFKPEGGKNTVTRLPVTFDLRIQNTGNVHLRPQGTVTIKNMFGRQTAVLKLNEVKGAVLPDSIRDYAVSWEKEIKTDDQEMAKSGNFFQEIARQWKNFGLGVYTVTAAVTYGTGGGTLSASTKVTIFPWQLLLVSLIVLAVVICAVVYGLKAYNAAIIRRAEGRRNPPDRRQ